MPKVFSCSSCGGQHKRPVGARCQLEKSNELDSNKVATPVIQTESNKLWTEEQLQNRSLGQDAVWIANSSPASSRQ